jgi:hypothetical protein
MQDLMRDWHRWNLGERVLAVTMVISLVAIPTLLLMMRHLAAY